MRDDAGLHRGAERSGPEYGIVESGIVESGIFESRLIAFDFRQQPGQVCDSGNDTFGYALSPGCFVRQQFAEIGSAATYTKRAHLYGVPVFIVCLLAVLLVGEGQFIQINRIGRL